MYKNSEKSFLKYTRNGEELIKIYNINRQVDTIDELKKIASKYERFGKSFLKYMSKLDSSPYDINYRKNVARSLFGTFTSNLKDKSFIDLGPGTGEALIVAKEIGISNLSFVDNCPFYARYLEILGFEGSFENYCTPSSLDFDKKYDIILSKGSINADIMNDNLYPVGIDDWIKKVISISNIDSHIIICPTYKEGKKRYCPSQGRELCYVCENPSKFRKSIFFSTLINNGFKPLIIDGFNIPVELYPFTFYRGNETLKNVKSVSY